MLISPNNLTSLHKTESLDEAKNKNQICSQVPGTARH